MIKFYWTLSRNDSGKIFIFYKYEYDHEMKSVFHILCKLLQIFLDMFFLNPDSKLFYTSLKSIFLGNIFTNYIAICQAFLWNEGKELALAQFAILITFETGKGFRGLLVCSVQRIFIREGERERDIWESAFCARVFFEYSCNLSSRSVWGKCNRS